MLSAAVNTSCKNPGDLDFLLPVTPPPDYLVCFTLVAAITVTGWLVKSFISATNLSMLYLLAVVVIAFRRGLRPAIFTAIIGVLAFDFFFVPPYLTFRVTDTDTLITFAGMIIVGALVSLLVTRAREHGYAAQEREKETGTLYALSQDLAVAVDADAIIAAVIRHIREIFQWESVILLPDKDSLIVHPSGTGLTLDEDDIAVATWAFQHAPMRVMIQILFMGHDSGIFRCRVRSVSLELWE